MKKLIFILFLLSISVNAQSWNSIVTTSLNISNADYIENYADKDGIHIVTYDDYTDDIKYYLISSSGSLIRSATISTNGEFPNIIGNENAVYIVYREGSNIRVKKSTDAGATWSQKANQSIGSNECSGIDASINADGIHTVWSIGDNNGYNMETNYKMYRPSNDDWVDFKNVTDYSNGYGVTPTVTLSPNRVHVGYNSSDYVSNYAVDENEMSRTKYNDTWHTQQTIASNQSCRGKIFASTNKLYDFYYNFDENSMGSVYIYPYFRYRNFGSTSWSSSTFLTQYPQNPEHLLSICETENGKIHTFIDSSDNLSDRIIINGSIDSYTSIVNNNWIAIQNCYAVYNDIYVNWRDDNSDYLKLRQYDANPKTPENFSKTTSNNAPKVTWSYSNEPDIQHYQVWRRWIEGSYDSGWQLKATTTSNSYTDSDFIVGGKPYSGTVYYKVRAKDNSGNLSSYTNTVYFYYSGTTWKLADKNGKDNSITTYDLFSNYPNPFNPTTTITYQIPNDGFVNLTVYNSLGQEVAVLVNRQQTQGKYSVQFNSLSAGQGLPSGVYFYRIQVSPAEGSAGEFISVKKMLLVK